MSLDPRLMWKLDINSVGSLKDMVITVPSDAIGGSNYVYKTKYDRSLDGIPKLQLAQMLSILKENREYFRVLRSNSVNLRACDLYCDLLLICLLKINQHQFSYLKPLDIINKCR